MAEFRYAIVYVKDVPAMLDFYGRAFGLTTRFLHESGTYGELETGSTALAFARHDLAATNLPDGYQRLTDLPRPAGVEIGLTVTDVAAAVDRAVEAGAVLLSGPTVKPWGQTVAYLRADDGMLVELCTAIES